MSARDCPGPYAAHDAELAAMRREVESLRELRARVAEAILELRPRPPSMRPMLPPHVADRGTMGLHKPTC